MSAIPAGPLVDGSGTIATGGTSQAVFTANAGRQYVFIQNLSVGDLWVNFGIAAVVSQPSIRIPAGGSLEFSAAGTGIVPTSTVNIIGATTSQAFTAKQA